MSDYVTLASDELIKTTADALKNNGFLVQIVEDLVAAKGAIAKEIPKNSSVFTGTSITLETAGIMQLLNDSGDYEALRSKMMEHIREHPEDAKGRKAITAAPDYMVASAAAITKDGEIMVASATGSQLSPEVYGAGKVIFVVSANKIVADISAGIKRIKEYVHALEQERLQAAYNNKDIKSHFNKLLIYREDSEKRVTVILVKEQAGF